MPIENPLYPGLASSFPGKPLKLREDAYRQVHERVWIFDRAVSDLIFLIHKSGDYGLVVKKEDIDWNESQILSKVL